MTPKQQRSLKTLVDQALQALEDLGVPLDGLTLRRKEKMAKAFLAVAGSGPDWHGQKRKTTVTIGSCCRGKLLSL